ncbi:MAG: hypothetical protein AABX91_02920 [Nanoarchaeota archaeon]
MSEKFTFNVYSYKRLDGRKGYLAFSEDEDISLSKSLQELLELRPVSSYTGFSINKKLPILRAVMHHQGSRKDLKSKIERIIEA